MRIKAMKSHEHKYISGTIGDECDFCGLLKTTIEAIEYEPDEEKRTNQQNKSLHLYFRHIAKALNDSGLTVDQVLENFTMELVWSEELVKEILWRTAQKRMFGKSSTTQLLKKEEIDTLHDVITRFLGEKLHLEYIPFPSEEELSLKELTK